MNSSTHCATTPVHNDPRRIGRIPISQLGQFSDSETIWQRRIGMSGEMTWLIASITIQMYVAGASGYWIDIVLLVTYIICFNGRLGSLSKAVLPLGVALGLSSISGIGSGVIKDFYDPLLMGLQSIAIMGIFVAKYHQRRDATYLAIMLVVLLLVGSFTSMKRNNLFELWAEGQRLGVNLQAMFIMVAVAYGFLFERYWKLAIIPLYFILFWLGSRTAFITALALPIFLSGFYFKTRKNLQALVLPLAAAFLGVIAMINLLDLGEIAKSAGLPVAYQRMFDETVKEGAQGRAELSQFWLTYLLEHPTLFGNGIESYGSRFGPMFPHNGYLHVFNGLGVICGCVYFWVVGKVLFGLVRYSAILPMHIAWAGALVCTILMRKLGEAQLLITPIHAAGFALAYGFGLALWGVERAKVITEAGGRAQVPSRR